MMRFRPPNFTWSWGLPSTCILFFVVSCAPFPFGSTNDISIAFWCFCLGAALIFAPTQYVRRQHAWLIAGIVVIVITYAVVLHEQVSDHPWMAPFHPIWQKASDLLGVPLTPSASIAKNQAFFAIGAPLANILSILLGTVIGANRLQAKRILWVIAISGSIYAVYGVVSFLAEPTLILWRDKKAYFGSVTGTFINRNTAAAYFGSCTLIWILLILERVRRHLPERKIEWGRLLTSIPKIPSIEFVPQLFGALVCLMAMFMTTSRAGVGLSLATMIVALTIYLRRDLPPRIGIMVSLALGIIVALGLLQLFGGRVSSRFDSQGLVDEGRLEAWKSTIRIALNNPWFGTGMGTFQWAFPAYRSDSVSISGIWDIAHSTPLEIASEMGLPAATLIALAWIVMLLVLLRGVVNRRRDVAIPLAAAAIASLSLSHSCIDFTLQIPGFSIPMFALMGAGLAQSFRTRGPSGVAGGRR